MKKKVKFWEEKWYQDSHSYINYLAYYDYLCLLKLLLQQLQQQFSEMLIKYTYQETHSSNVANVILKICETKD